MANNLGAVARSSYCIAANNALRACESYRSGKKIIDDINMSYDCHGVHFFVYEVISIFLCENC